ncbi:putative transporter YaaJ [Escherichia coli]|uniref:Putative transporter YaaJ n=1 Tax=Escherichia coli TaxID=562 RepID=A0A376X4U1_ECOLX|nr:putative transporter YaaJ [Escherichia coli]
MGSTPNAAAAAASWPPHPAAQGIVQMIGIFIDTPGHLYGKRHADITGG